MHMHADPFAEDGRRKLHGQNLAAALLEGAFQRMESALREPGGEILAVGAVPCTAPQAPCLLKPWFDLFFISLGWTCKFWRDRTGQKLVEGAKLCCAVDFLSLKPDL